MTNPQQELVNVLNLMRNVAAHDLDTSNLLLDIADKLASGVQGGEMDEKTIGEIAQEIVSVSMKLTKQSREVSSSVSRVVGGGYG